MVANLARLGISVISNIKTIINYHNAKILFPKKSTEQRTCNCLNKENCPLKMSHYKYRLQS